MKKKQRKSREAGQHGIRNNGKLAAFKNQKSQERYEAAKSKTATEIDMSWMAQVPTGLEQ